MEQQTSKLSLPSASLSIMSNNSSCNFSACNNNNSFQKIQNLFMNRNFGILMVSINYAKSP